MTGTRILTATINGRDIPVSIVIGAPIAEGSEWKCPYSIAWPDKTVQRFARGVDGPQAAYLAQEMIGAAIYASDLHKKQQLRWKRPEEGYGFPVPRGMRDLLVGEDKRFEG
jgi:hypothetical protein